MQPEDKNRKYKRITRVEEQERRPIFFEVGDPKSSRCAKVDHNPEKNSQEKVLTGLEPRKLFAHHDTIGIYTFLFVRTLSNLSFACGADVKKPLSISHISYSSQPAHVARLFPWQHCLMGQFVQPMN